MIPCASPAAANGVRTQPGLPVLGEPRRLPLRPWMPPEWRRAVAGKEVTFHNEPPVRRECAKPAWIPPSEWSVRERRMPDAESHPGEFSFEFARFSRRIMDTWAQPWVREVWYSGVDQASKTNTMASCIGWIPKYGAGSRNIFYQMPDKTSSDRIMERKIIPMFRKSPALAVYLSRRADDTSLGSVTLNNGVSILPSWAGSLTSTAVFSAKYTFTDELDKMDIVGKEASPVERIKKRGRNFRLAKHFFASTPAGKWIYRGVRGCAQVWEAAGRCPHCDALVVMDEEHLDIPTGATPETIEAHPEEVGYFCNACGERWDESDRKHAYDRGDWVCVKGRDLLRPATVGFLLSAFPLPDVPLAHIAQTVLRAKGGDLSARRDLAHGIKAVDFEDAVSERKEDEILRLRDDRPAEQVPPEVDALLLSADTQDNGFWYTIRAWRFGENLTSWLLKAGYVPSAHPDDFSALDFLLETSYLDAAGRSHRISYGIIDSQGHRTSEVYQWCKRSGVFAARGAQGRKTNPVSVSKLEHFPGSNRPIPGGLNLYHLDTHFHKDVLVNKLRIDVTDPGAWVLHCGYSVLQLTLMEKNPGFKLASGLEEYSRHFCAEVRDEKGLWGFPLDAQGKPKKKPNHLWDCEQQQVALAYYLGFHKKKRMSAVVVTAPQPPPQATVRPSWFHNRRR